MWNIRWNNQNIAICNKMPFLADAKQKISAFSKADLIKSAFDHRKIFHQISFVVRAFYMAQMAFAGQMHFRALLI